MFYVSPPLQSAPADYKNKLYLVENVEGIFQEYYNKVVY